MRNVAYISQTETNTYNLSSLYSGYDNDQTVTKENLNWRVLNINENGMIDLISEIPITDYISFKGANGYNNGVYLLNEMSRTLYSNKEKRATARSMKIEDIQDKMDLSVWDYHNYTGGGVQYGNTRSYSSNKQYPVQWKNDNGIEGQSEDRSLIASTETVSETETNGNLTVTQSYWNNGMNGANFQKVRTSAGEEDANMYYNLLFYPNSVGTYYWLASRCVIAHNTSYAYFSMHYACDGYINYYSLFSSSGSTGSLAYSLRPIVSLPSTVVDINTGDGKSASTAFGMN